MAEGINMTNWRVRGLERLATCPSSEHISWVVAHRASGASRADPTVFVTHSAEDASLAEFACQIMENQSRGTTAVVEVSGWRAGTTGAVVVEYRARDGRDWEMHFDVAADGRVHAPRDQRALGGIDVSAHRPEELSHLDRAGVLDVFAQAYENGDSSYVADQFDRFGSVAIARLRSQVVGFYFVDIRELDLPVIGPHGCARPGLSCVRPDLRRDGLMISMATAAHRHSVIDSGAGGFALEALRLASPTSLNAALRGLSRKLWPPENDPFALHDHPTPTQVAVAADLAASFGSAGYDAATGVCVGTGHRVGTPRIDHDVTPDLVARFDPVNRVRGDTLLWITWSSPPPPAWNE